MLNSLLKITAKITSDKINPGNNNTNIKMDTSSTKAVTPAIIMQIIPAVKKSLRNRNDSENLIIFIETNICTIIAKKKPANKQRTIFTARVIFKLYFFIMVLLNFKLVFFYLQLVFKASSISFKNLAVSSCVSKYFEPIL